MSCNHVHTKILQVGDHAVWVGSRNDLENYIIEGYSPFLVINLTGGSVSAQTTKVSVVGEGPSAEKLIQNFVGLAPKYITMNIDWPDMSIPVIAKAFWYTLAEYIKTCLEGDVFIHCVGGHGRTGTLAAILLQLVGKMEGQHPIEWLRKHYCDMAVESHSQLWYIEAVTGLSCKKYEPAKTYQPTSGYVTTTQPYKDYASDAYDSTSLGAKSLKGGSSVIMDVSKEMYDDLIYDGRLCCYVDSNGEQIGETFLEAVSTLRERKAKKCTP